MCRVFLLTDIVPLTVGTSGSPLAVSLNLGNFGFHSSQKTLSFHILSKIYRTVILPVILYVCQTWSLTLREGVREQGAEENIWT
jgi:hypothetical protein